VVGAYHFQESALNCGLAEIYMFTNRIAFFGGPWVALDLLLARFIKTCSFVSINPINNLIV